MNFYEIFNFLPLSYSENAFLLQSFNRFTNSSAEDAVSWVFSWKSENLHFQCKMFWDQTRCSPWPWGGNFIFFNPIFQEASFPPKMHQTAKKGCFESKHKMHRSSLKNMTLEKYFFQIQTWRKPLLFLMDAHNHIKKALNQNTHCIAESKNLKGRLGLRSADIILKIWLITVDLDYIGQI